jgi:fructose-1-phosphate kinase PfkB-like protein
MRKRRTYINLTTVLTTIISVLTLLGVSYKVSTTVATKEDIEKINKKVDKIDIQSIKTLIDTTSRTNMFLIKELQKQQTCMFNALNYHIRNQGENEKILNELDKLNGLSTMIEDFEKKNKNLTLK